MENIEEMEEVNKKLEDMTIVHDVEEKLNFLLERRNDLKRSGQLMEDEERELLLNKAIIMRFLELENIKNEGVTLNLLSLLRDELNNSEELNYANKKLIGNHRLLECTHASEVFFFGKGIASGAVTKDNNLIVKNEKEKYVHSFNEDGLLNMSNYEFNLNNDSFCFENMKLKGACIYSDKREIHEELNSGYETIKERSSSYGCKGTDRVFPTMKGISRDMIVMYSIEEISPELFNKIESLDENVSKSM